MLIPLGDNIERRHFPIAGWLIILANVLVYAIEVRVIQTHQETDPEAIRAFFSQWGLTPSGLKEGHLFPLLSHMFMHADFGHLLGNLMIFGVFMGTLEAGLGSIRFLILYFFWGLVAGVTYCAMNWEDTMPMIGASGAIFGAVGAYFIAFGGLARVRLMLIFFCVFRFEVPAGAYVFFWMVIPQVLGIMAASERGHSFGVAWYAHVGGFAAGALSLGVLRADVLSHFHRNKHGKLVFAASSEEANLQPHLIRRPKPEPVVPQVASHCCYCAADLVGAEKLGQGLYRCANPACHSLNFVQLASSEDRPKHAGELIAAS